MSDTVIRVENLGKKYIIGHQQQGRSNYVALRDVMANGLKSFGRRVLKPGGKIVANSANEEFWALKDVSFEIKRGDRVGIIGRNGAGKSTLLKILSRITEPTTGRILLKGRVASLLEVGTGFHPELSGRENIYLNGAILGMSKVEIKKKFDEIVAFAEVEKFLDTPVKRYSSGMYVRLAFAVAAHLEPEILVVDEVLAVGDTAFQKKCLGKLGQVSESGKTVFFVSHNLSAVQRLCKRGIYLESGKLKLQNSISEVIEAYQRTNYSRDAIAEIGNSKVQFSDWKLVNTSTQSSIARGSGGGFEPAQLQHSCKSREYCHFVFTLISKHNLPNIYIGFALWDSKGELILAASSLDKNNKYIEVKEGINKVSFKMKLPLKAGIYYPDISINSTDLGQLERWVAEPPLSIVPQLNTQLPERWHGLLNEEVDFEFSS